MENVVFTLPLDGVLILVGVVLSLLVSLVTTKVTEARTKAYLLAGLSAASQIVAEFTIAVSDGTLFDIGQALIRAIGTLLVAIGTYHMLTSPTGLNDRLQRFNLNPFKRTDGRHDAEDAPAPVTTPAADDYRNDTPAVG